MSSQDKRKNPRQKLHYPQEIEVWFVIPAIHRTLAQKFKERKQPQKRIAELLNVTEACVSQYFSGIRGTKVTFSESILQEIDEAANRVLSEETSVIREVQRLCRHVKETGLLCELHKQYGSASESCSVCKSSKGGNTDS